MGVYLEQFREDLSSRGIDLDDFQVDSCQALEDGKDVLLSAPTGAGKTIVALFAIELSFAQSTRCIYTTPIKALSNQKFKELGERYGTESVGIMTGDVTINRDAPVLVMTTEVLRNMLYQDDPIREELGFVILDEVHYLADAMRGPTWEEVILELPSHTRLVSLSATVSNSDEFGDWLNSVRGPTTVVSTTWRPVPLQQQVVIGRKVYDAFTRPGHHELAQTERVPNPRLVQSIGSLRDVPRMNPSGRRRIIEILERRELLPAIHFIFSRKQCDRAVIDLLKAGVSLTTREEKRAIRRASQALAEQMSEEDLHIIRYNTFEAALVHGYSAHHAGIYPAQKELIEALMAAGLLKLVYATGTLALGINMPVRTVVIEQMTKWDGDAFAPLSAIEYTQLIGRAGRRGLDPVGYALIAAAQDFEEEHFFAIASGALEPLKSAFFPSYNTAVNLLALNDYQTARAILARSFAQFQRNRDVVDMETRLERMRRRVAKLRDELDALCEHGSVAEYAELHAAAGRASKASRKAAKRDYRERIARSFDDAQMGDIVAYGYGGEVEYAYIAAAHGPVLRAVTWEGQFVWLDESSVRSELRTVGSYQLPYGMKLRSQDSRDILADAVMDAVAERADLGVDEDLLGSWDRNAVRESEELLAHPVHSCPDRDRHLAAAREFQTVSASVARLEGSVTEFEDSVGREFDQTCALLAHMGILQGEPGAYRLGPGAEPLRHIHNEADLLIFECMKEPAFGQLSPEEFAGMCTAFLHDDRFGRMPPVSPRAFGVISRNQEFLQTLEAEYGLDRTPEVSAGASQTFAAWASGASLATCLGMSMLSPGDFITVLRRVVDLLDQLVHAGRGSVIGDLAQQALELVKRPGALGDPVA